VKPASAKMLSVDGSETPGLDRNMIRAKLLRLPHRNNEVQAGRALM